MEHSGKFREIKKRGKSEDFPRSKYPICVIVLCNKASKTRAKKTKDYKMNKVYEVQGEKDGEVTLGTFYNLETARIFAEALLENDFDDVVILNNKKVIESALY